MFRIKTGLISGLIGTIVAGAMLLMNNALHSVPEIHITRTLSRLLGAPDHIMVGVAAILIIGIFVCGTLFAVYSSRVTVNSHLAKCFVFAIASWLFMMIVFMPLGGSGFFGLNGGPVVPVAMLVLNLAYWTVLGMTYRWLGGPLGRPETREAAAMSLDTSEGR